MHQTVRRLLPGREARLKRCRQAATYVGPIKGRHAATKFSEVDACAWVFGTTEMEPQRSNQHRQLSPTRTIESACINIDLGDDEARWQSEVVAHNSLR